MRDESQSFVFFETPGSLILLETPAVAASPARLVMRLKMIAAAVVVAALAGVAVSSADSSVEPETTQWQRVAVALEACSSLDPGTPADIHCGIEAANTP